MKTEKIDVQAPDRIENLRLEYTQIMENFRQILRSGVRAVLIFLAITGVTLKFGLNFEYSLIELLLIVSNISLGLLEFLIGIIIVQYFKNQHKRIQNISLELGLSEENIQLKGIKIVYICFAGFSFVVVSWIYFLIWKY